MTLRGLLGVLIDPPAEGGPVNREVNFGACPGKPAPNDASVQGAGIQATAVAACDGILPLLSRLEVAADETEMDEVY